MSSISAFDRQLIHNAEYLIGFYTWLMTKQSDDDYLNDMWEKITTLLPLEYLVFESIDTNPENSFTLTFGTVPLLDQTIIDDFYYQIESGNPPSAQEFPFHLHETQDSHILAFWDATPGFSDIMIVSTGESAASILQQQVLHTIFSAIVMKNYRISYNMAQQEISLIHDDRRTQYNFISGITHDLRNPLGCIKGYVTTLLRTDVQWEPDMQQQFLEVINTESDHLEDMITNLLETARLQSGNYELHYQSLNLFALLLDVQKTNVERYPELTIHIQTDTETPVILADQKKLTQAFQNLVDNARKHAKIFEIWFKILTESDGFCIQCEDHGEGIAEERLKNIFDKFSRTPEFSPGSHGVGLGLYISKQIIERHQGTIQVKSLPGTGTTFYIYLPKAPTRKLGKEKE